MIRSLRSCTSIVQAQAWGCKSEQVIPANRSESCHFLIEVDQWPSIWFLGTDGKLLSQYSTWVRKHGLQNKKIIHLESAQLCCVMLQAREKNSDSPSGYYTCKSWTTHQYILTMISRLLPVSQITPRSCHAGRGAVNMVGAQSIWLAEREKERC